MNESILSIFKSVKQKRPLLKRRFTCKRKRVNFHRAKSHYLKLLLTIMLAGAFIRCWTQGDLHFKLVENALLYKLDINGIHASHDGKLWFGTANGLASFDGNDVKVYPLANEKEKTLFTDRIYAFAEDDSATIWIYTIQGKLARFSPMTGHYTEVPFLKNDSLKKGLVIAKFYFDSEGKLWMGSNRGFLIYDVKTDRCQQYNLRPEDPASWTKKYQNSVYDFGEDLRDKQKMWIASFGMGLFCFDKKTKKLTQHFTPLTGQDIIQQTDHVTQIDVRDSVIWFGTWGMGMGKYNIVTGQYTMFPCNQQLYVGVYPHGHVIRRLVRYAPDEYFVAAGDTVPAIFSTTTGRYRYINNEALQKTINRTSGVASDGMGNYWCVKGGRLYAASTQYDVFRALPVPLQQPHPFRLPNILYKMVWDDKQQLYYAPVDQGDGIYVYDKFFRYLTTIPIVPEKLNDNLSAARNLQIDGRGRLWTLADSLCVFDSVKKRMVKASEKYGGFPLIQQPFAAFTAMPNGNLVFLNNKRSLCFFNVSDFGMRTIPLPAVSKPAVEYHCENLLFDESRACLYACDGTAIFQYRISDGRFRILEAGNGSSPLPPVNVSTYALDEKGNLWVGSRGIYIFEPEALHLINVLDEASGLTDNVNINLLQGPPGYMFFFTPHGGNVYAEQDSSFVHFDLSNGAPSDFPLGYSFANGRLFFSPGAGAQNVYTDVPTLLSLQKLVRPYLSGIRITNQDLSSDTVAQYLTQLILRHNQNNVNFSFSSTEFAFPDKIEYAYKLEGQDKEWSYTNYLNRSISYTNLKPDHYIFHIKARLLGGKWTEMQYPLHITIVPAFWQTAWFKILVAVLIAALVYFFFQQRLRNERKKAALNQQHRSRLAELEADALRAQMNPHFIFNCLNSIKALIQQGKNETAVSYLTTFSKLIRTLFQNADKREITLYEELETCKLYTQLEALRFGDKIRFAFVVDETLDLKDIFVPALILQPFIENAIWHGLVPKDEGGRVTVLMRQNNGTVQCIVDDEGIGRELSKQFKDDNLMAHQSKGIALTQNRLRLDRILHHRDDTIAVIDKIGDDGKAAGTQVVLSFKNEKE